MKSKKIPADVFKFLWYFSKKYKFRTLLLFLIIVMSTIFTAYFAPYILKVIINSYEAEQLGMAIAMFYIFLYIIFLSAEPLFLIFKNKLFLITEDFIKRDFLNSTFNFLLNNDIEYFNKNYSGDLSSKLTGLISDFEAIFRGFLNIFNSALFFSVVLVIIFSFNPYICFISIVWILLFYFSLKKSIAIRTERFKVNSEARNKSAGIINDCLINISNIKSFSHEKEEIRNVKKQSLDIIRSSSNTIGISSIVMAIIYIMMNSYFFIMLSFLFYSFKQGVISLGEFMFMFQIFIMLLGFVRSGLTSLVEINPAIARFQNSLDKIFVEPKIKNSKSVAKLEVNKGKISFKNIKFIYK